MKDITICSRCGWRHIVLHKYCSMCGAVLSEINIKAPRFVLANHPFNILFRTNKDYQYDLEKITYSKENKLLSDFSNQNLRISKQIVPVNNLKMDTLGETSLQFHFKQETSHETIQVIKAESIHLSVGEYQNIPICKSSDHSDIIMSSYWGSLDFTFRFNDDLLNDLVDIELIDNEKVFQLSKLKLSDQNHYTFILENNDYQEFYNSLAKEKKKNRKVKMLMRYQQFLTYEIPLNIQMMNIPQIMINNEEILRNTYLFEGEDKKIQVVFKLKDTSKKSEIGEVKIITESQGIHVKQSNDYFDEKDLLTSNFQIDYQLLEEACIERFGSGKSLSMSFTLSFCVNDKQYFKNIKYSIEIRDPQNVKTIDVLALDFGTTNTCFAYFDSTNEQISEYLDYLADSSVESIESFKNNYKDNSQPEIPTFLSFAKFSQTLLNHKVKIHDYAFNALPAKTYAYMFKSLIPYMTSRAYYDESNNLRILNPLELTKIYLKKILDGFAKHKMLKPKEIVMSYPANFSIQTKLQIFNVIRELGYQMDDNASISEPEAIALHYIINNKIHYADKPLTIAVYDCGGGTTDIAIVKYSQNGDCVEIEILATWATDQFSGNYINWFLAKQLSDAHNYTDDFKENLQENFDNHKVKYFYNQFLYLEHLKRIITERFNKKVPVKKEMREQLISSLPDDFKNREETFRKMENETDKNLTVVNTMMQKLWEIKKVENFNPDYLILAGNSTKLPIFGYVAEKKFSEVNILSDGYRKISVSIGLHKFKRELGNADIDIKGLSLSNKSFYILKGLNQIDCIFPLWSDMSKENIYCYEKKRFKNDVKIYQIHDEFKSHTNINMDDLNEAFSVPIMHIENKVYEKLYLRYIQFKMSYRWEIELENGEIYETDYHEIY